MSASLYAILRDTCKVDARLVTGDLIYNGSYIFKQDYSIKAIKQNFLSDWSGHAWVEIENMICDLSIFRTIYSDEFTNHCKDKLLTLFGKGRGCIIATHAILKNDFNLEYNAIDYLDDTAATAILKGAAMLNS